MTKRPKQIQRYGWWSRLLLKTSVLRDMQTRLNDIDEFMDEMGIKIDEAVSELTELTEKRDQHSSDFDPECLIETLSNLLDGISTGYSNIADLLDSASRDLG